MTRLQPQRMRRKAPSPGATNVAIIGAGRGGTALMEIFANDPLVQIVGVAEIDPHAPGLSLANRLRIPVTDDYQQLLAMERVDLIIDVSGNPDVWQFLSLRRVVVGWSRFAASGSPRWLAEAREKLDLARWVEAERSALSRVLG